MKRNLRLGFADTFENAIKFWTYVFSKRYEVVRNDTNPQLLIFGDNNFGNTHGKYTCPKMFFTGENVRPNFYDCDFAVTFDHINSPEHYRLPLYVLEMWSMTLEGYDHDYLFKGRDLDITNDFYTTRKFCSFVQSNPNVPERNEFFHLLNSKKTIDSGGPLFNNVGYVINRPGGHLDKLGFLTNYKFNIAFENGSYPGYVTEKLLNAFYANTVPIYWGSEHVGRDFNTKAFINSNDFYSPEELVDYVLELNSNEKKYLDILAEPSFTGNISNEYCNLSNFLDWFEIHNLDLIGD